MVAAKTPRLVAAQEASIEGKITYFETLTIAEPLAHTRNTTMDVVTVAPMELKDTVLQVLQHPSPPKPPHNAEILWWYEGKKLLCN